MERSPILLDRKDQHWKNSNPAKAIYRFNAIPIKIPRQFFTDLERKRISFIWKNKKPRIAKASLYNKGTYRGITVPDIKLYYRATVIKTAWCWHKNGDVDKCNQIEDPNITPHTHEHLIFDKEAKIIQWKKESIFNMEDVSKTPVGNRKHILADFCQ